MQLILFLLLLLLLVVVFFVVTLIFLWLVFIDICVYLFFETELYFVCA